MAQNDYHRFRVRIVPVRMRPPLRMPGRELRGAAARRVSALAQAFNGTR